jgi:hypothetical protein
MLRTLVRDKNTLVAEASDWLRRMQKSLDQMNVRVLTTGAGAWSALLTTGAAGWLALSP